MPLDNTKKVLRRLREKYGDILREAKRDIKPDYLGNGINGGYNYHGIDDYDRDFIYNSVSELDIIINNVEGSIRFDIDNVFITEAKAIIELKQEKNHIFLTLNKLGELKNKYEEKECSHYPLEMCFNLYKQINDLLNEVLNSNEFKEFEDPGVILKLTNETNDLKFRLYWNRKRWDYIFHLLAFIPFIVGAIYVILYKDDKKIIGLSKTLLFVLSGLITIIFNIMFNNHNSFKDSFKLLLPSSRKKLIQKEKVEFNKTLTSIQR